MACKVTCNTVECIHNDNESSTCTREEITIDDVSTCENYEEGYEP